MHKQDFESVEKYDEYLMMIEDTVDQLLSGDEETIASAKKQLKREREKNI
jgi:hypothetical protein